MNQSSTNRDAAALQSDYGGDLSKDDAEAMLTRQGRETVIGY